MYNPVDREFEFKRGAIFAHIVIADEINRSSPKTQSALLEAMEEGQVTVDGDTHPLPRPFLVVATQNPLEMEGTYALPEAQRDRFMMRISMGYPDAAAEALMLRQRDVVNPLAAVAAVVDAADISAARSPGRGPCTSHRRSRSTRSPSLRPPESTRACISERARVRRCNSFAPPRSGRRSTGASS